jgi:subtilisin family serine protease
MMSASARSSVVAALGAALAAVALLTSTPSHAKAATADAELPGEVLVKLRSTGALGPLLTKYQLSLVSQFGARPIYRLKVAGLADVHAKIAALATELDVLIAEPNFVHSSPEARRIVAWTIGTPAAYAAQWAPRALRLPEAHRLSSGAGIRVAVLDTGVDRQHPALAGRLLPGFDFVDFDHDPTEVGSPVTNISFGHGTHVAGLVAMVAPAAKIMPLRVLDAQGQGNAWVLAEAMLYAVDPDANPGTNDGAHVINLSLGSTSRTRILDSVAQLAACAIPAVAVDPVDDVSDPGYNADKQRCSSFSGAVIVAAAGNDASSAVRQYPAAERVYGLLAVTASTADSRLAAFSNFGAWVDIAAPGQGITSAVPGGGYGTWSGTSMAAPLAAGTAALVRALNPGLSPTDVTRRLVRLSSGLCGTRLREVDAAAAVLNVLPAVTICP